MLVHLFQNLSPVRRDLKDDESSRKACAMEARIAARDRGLLPLVRRLSVARADNHFAPRIQQALAEEAR